MEASEQPQEGTTAEDAQRAEAQATTPDYSSVGEDAPATPSNEVDPAPEPAASEPDPAPDASEDAPEQPASAPEDPGADSE